MATYGRWSFEVYLVGLVMKGDCYCFIFNETIASNFLCPTVGLQLNVFHPIITTVDRSHSSISI